jgi:hypothetical protein
MFIRARVSALFPHSFITTEGGGQSFEFISSVFFPR